MLEMKILPTDETGKMKLCHIPEKKPYSYSVGPEGAQDVMLINRNRIKTIVQIFLNLIKINLKN